ncbi:hypothetical protein MED297_13632 [Reinekea sp. MED297]|uniref:DUF4034 domain-containing protein n=2 Tax=Reinekea TaxID=230494 RepID=A4BCK2_9GAMM|nr:hypothetical protein MED297_13632 [Reinekea sp. MED297] [Reinekea blandensis MED297]
MKHLSTIVLFMLLTGCATTKLPSNLSGAILNSDDLQTVKEGLPSYLLMVDALTETYPKSASMQLTASSLNGAYAGVFVPDDQQARRKKLAEKALEHAFQAFCLHDSKACGMAEWELDRLSNELPQWDREADLPYLYAVGSSWAGYIQANSDDWLAIAQLGQAEAVLKQVVSIAPNHEKGTAQLYLGVMNSILPPSLGGKPDIARGYYERAIEAGEQQNLIIYVYYASNFARLLFDKALHDRLLEEALALDPYVDGYTLQNVYAQEQARALLASSDSYF